MLYKQSALISSDNIKIYNEFNNDINIEFDKNLFINEPHSLNLTYFNMECSPLLFGNTNDTIQVSFTNNNNIIKTYTIFINNKNNIKTDNNLSKEITSALNNIEYEDYDIEFLCYTLEYDKIVNNINIESDNTLVSYSILATNDCTILFNNKNSIGPLIGFGYGIYNITSSLGIYGILTPSITSYNYIECNNNSGYIQYNKICNNHDESFIHVLEKNIQLSNIQLDNSNIIKNNGNIIYSNFYDKNCKMLLFDSNNNLLLNLKHPMYDTSISINSKYNNTIYYNNINNILKEIEIELNKFSNFFTPSAVFEVSYDISTKSICIINTTNALFGIGFDFKNYYKLETTGSLHKILGFEEKTYLGVRKINSTRKLLIFSNTFSEEYVMIGSNIIDNNNNNNTNSIIPLGPSNITELNNFIFAIPYHLTENYMSNIDNLFSVPLYNSKLNNNNNDKFYINFYIRLKSGRHCSILSPYTLLLDINYN